MPGAGHAIRSSCFKSRAVRRENPDSGAMAIGGAAASTSWYNERLAQLSSLAGAGFNPAGGEEMRLRREAAEYDQRKDRRFETMANINSLLNMWGEWGGGASLRTTAANYVANASFHEERSGTQNRRGNQSNTSTTSTPAKDVSVRHRSCTTSRKYLTVNRDRARARVHLRGSAS